MTDPDADAESWAAAIETAAADVLADTKPEPDTDRPRPTFTVTAAAEATGKSRRTISRLLDAGALEGAERDDSGAWSIPAEALIAAGLTVHAPSPPDAEPEPTPEPAGTEADQLRAELADWRRRAEVAEAIAAERSAALDDLRDALAMAVSRIDIETLEVTDEIDVGESPGGVAVSSDAVWVTNQDDDGSVSRIG